jgi:aryl-alcohol dehydrogenase-like predicted oxidoreductase
MEYRELGHTGLMVSVVGYGTAPLGDMFGGNDEDSALQSAYRALDAGINFFDSSPFYGKGLAEERLGKVLRGRRDEIIVGTKAGRYRPEEFDFSADRIRRGFEDSLRLLGTNHVLGLLTVGGPPPHIARLVGEEIRAAARRAVEVCRDRGADVSFLANQYSIQRSGCATTLIGTAKQRHLDSAVAAVDQPIDEDLLAEVLAAIGRDRGRHWMGGLAQNN